MKLMLSKLLAEDSGKNWVSINTDINVEVSAGQSMLTSLVQQAVVQR